MAPNRSPFHRASLAVVSLVAVAALGGCNALFAPTEELPPGYAIVYGVSDYSSINDLGQPDDDAHDVAAMLADAGWTIISGGARVNAEATMANLEADFEAAIAQAGPDSRFFFYFAGHGYGDGMESNYTEIPEAWTTYLTTEAGDEPTAAGPLSEVLLLHDADPYNNVELAIEESVTDDRLAELVASVPSRQRIVVIDACHSGGFIGSGTAIDTAPRSYDGQQEGGSILDTLNAMTLYLEYDAAVAQDIGERSAIVISAAGEQEFSYEGDWLGYSNGVFTHFFLESRLHADRNYDGYVTATEAFSHASASIASIANERLSGENKFLPRVSGGAIDFILFPAK